MRIVLAALILLVAAFVLWGVGSAMRRLVGAPRGRWSVSIGIGLATLIAVGGILNLAHIAYRPTIWLTMLAAVIVSINEARHSAPLLKQAIPAAPDARFEFALATFVILAAMLFTIITQVPPRAFNDRDDLEKYFVHPVRMLETGTLRGSPLSALGSETLGGQSFLHGVVLSFAPLPYINGVDAAFGLFVLLLIAAAAAWKRFGWFPGAALGALLIAVINPLDANVAGLYTAATLIATAVMLVADEREDSSPMLLGLVYAAMVAIKPTFGLFAALHCPFSTLAAAAQKKHWRAALAWPIRVVACSALCIAPYLFTYLPTYLGRGAFAARSVYSAKDLSDVSLFSTLGLFDGDSVLPYTAIAGVALFVALLAVAACTLTQEKDEARGGNTKSLGLFAGAASGAACYLVLISFFSLVIGYQVCVRYSVPFLLGACVIPVLMAPSLLPIIPRAASKLIPAIAGIAIIAAFTPAAIGRDNRAVQYGSILEFARLATSPGYLPYIRDALSVHTRQEIVQLQSHVPAGEPLFAWISAPYFLDFRRNPIIDVDTAGTSTPWAHVPTGTRYFLWQYQGYAIWHEADLRSRMYEPGIGARDRLIAHRSLDLANVLTQLANNSQVIAQLDDHGERYVLFRVPAATQ